MFEEYSREVFVNRQSKEYIEMATKRRFYMELYQSLGQKNYDDYIWAEQLLEKLEKKSYLSDQDIDDLRIAKRIIRGIEVKSKGKETRENHSTECYIWHTVSDSKVRSSHADNDGKIFSWDDDGPHPGEDYNCRCWAEPYYAEKEHTETKNQYVTKVASDKGEAWDTWDLSHYYFYGNGVGLRLENIGLLDSVINFAKNHDTGLILRAGSIFERVESQIFKESRKNGQGSFSGDWDNSYRFHGLVWATGGAIVKGDFKVEVIDKGNFLIIHADINYTFEDRFKDPIDTFNWYEGENTDIELPGGKPFDINGEWSTHLDALITKDPSKSKFE